VTAIDGSTAVVTGWQRGLGKHLVAQLLSLGATKVYATARRPRLHARWVRFDERKKRSVVANAAIARGLAGWWWSLAVLDDSQLSG
jgi:NAD(P)-dependent dehydrogenase (short-subunit alcohol dehydrogenase family)